MSGFSSSHSIGEEGGRKRLHSLWFKCTGHWKRTLLAEIHTLEQTSEIKREWHSSDEWHNEKFFSALRCRWKPMCKVMDPHNNEQMEKSWNYSYLKIGSNFFQIRVSTFSKQLGLVLENWLIGFKFLPNFSVVNVFNTCKEVHKIHWKKKLPKQIVKN